MLIGGLLLLAAAPPATAGWSPLGSPEEPVVELQLHTRRPQLLYARVVVSEGTEEAYLWRSKNGGATWRNVQSGLLRPSSALAVDADPEQIWVWTPEGQLWSSADAGGTWTLRHKTPSDQIFPDVRHLFVIEQEPGHGAAHDCELPLEAAERLRDLDKDRFHGVV